MNYSKISEYIEKTKELIDRREACGNDDHSEKLLDEMDDLWYSLTDEETLMIDQIVSLELVSRQSFGCWLEKDWYVCEEDFTID